VIQILKKLQNSASINITKIGHSFQNLV